jgi:hypothetical protein
MGFLEAIHVHDYESHQNILYKCSSKIILVVIEAGNWIDVVYLDHIIHVGFFYPVKQIFIHACVLSLLPAHSTGSGKQFLEKNTWRMRGKLPGKQQVVQVANIRPGTSPAAATHGRGRLESTSTRQATGSFPSTPPNRNS